MDTAVKIPLRERINFRIITFVALIALLIGYPAYVYIDSALSGGIKHRDDGYVEVDLKAMSTFPFDQVNGTIDDVPQKWRELDGKKVIFYGEMWAPNAASPEIDKFELVYSIAKCCFSGPPQIQHFVQSKVKNGTVPNYSGLVQVRGTLRVDVQKGEDKVRSVYHLDVEDVQQVG